MRPYRACTLTGVPPQPPPPPPPPPSPPPPPIALLPEVAHPRLDGGTGALKATLRFPSAAAAAAAATATTAPAASGLAEGEVDNAPNQATDFAAGTSAPEPTFRFRAATAPARTFFLYQITVRYSSRSTPYELFAQR